MVNLSGTAIHKDSIITYISVSDFDFKNYIAKLPRLDKIIFHPYNLIAYRFLKIALKTFPSVKVYWMCWSYELYSSPFLGHNLYGPFSAGYINGKSTSFGLFKSTLKKI